MAVTGLPALSVVQGVLSVTGVVVQRPIRPASAPVPCRVGSHRLVRHWVDAGQGVTPLGIPVEPVGNPSVSESPGPVCSVGSVHPVGLFPPKHIHKKRLPSTFPPRFPFPLPYNSPLVRPPVVHHRIDLSTA